MSPFDDEVNASFFRPLCCKNQAVYYECIRALIEKSRLVPVLYETDAKNCLISCLQDCKDKLKDEEISDNSEETLSTKKSLPDNAGAVIRYFRRCKWLSAKELGRSGDNIASVTPICIMLIDAIDKIFNSTAESKLTNRIFAVYDILTAACGGASGRTSRPYKFILMPLMENISGLRNELLALNDSIQAIMENVIKMTELNTFGQFLVKDDMIRRFFDDYFFIKKDGLIPEYISEIQAMLHKVMLSDLYSRIIDEYSETSSLRHEAAAEFIREQFDSIQQFFEYDYAKGIDFIDAKINNYYNLYSMRMLMVLSNGTNLQDLLNDLLEGLKGMSAEQRETALGTIGECFRLRSYRYIGAKSIEKRKKRNPSPKKSTVSVGKLTDEEKKRLTDEALREYSDICSIEATAKYFDSLMGSRQSAELISDMLKTRNDAMMMAASIIYSGSSGFPYEVEFLDGTVKSETADVSRIIIKRK